MVNFDQMENTKDKEKGVIQEMLDNYINNINQQLLKLRNNQ